MALPSRYLAPTAPQTNVAETPSQANTPRGPQASGASKRFGLQPQQSNAAPRSSPAQSSQPASQQQQQLLNKDLGKNPLLV